MKCLEPQTGYFDKFLKDRVRVSCLACNSKLGVLSPLKETVLSVAVGSGGPPERAQALLEAQGWEVIYIERDGAIKPSAEVVEHLPNAGFYQAHVRRM